MRKWVDNIGVDFLNKAMNHLEIALHEIKGFNYKTASLEF